MEIKKAASFEAAFFCLFLSIKPYYSFSRRICSNHISDVDKQFKAYRKNDTAVGIVHIKYGKKLLDISHAGYAFDYCYCKRNKEEHTDLSEERFADQFFFSSDFAQYFILVNCIETSRKSF